MGEARRRRERQAETERDMAILFPHEDVTLLSGEHVIVRAWSIDQGVVLTKRMVDMFTKIRAAGQDHASPGVWLEIALPEIKHMVRETIGWTPEEFDARCCYEDLLELFGAVLRTSITREDGRGALPKILDLLAGLRPMLGVAGQASSSPSTSS